MTETLTFSPASMVNGSRMMLAVDKRGRTSDFGKTNQY